MGGVSMSRRLALAGTAAVAGAVVAAESAQAAAAVLREYQAVKTRDGKPIKLVLYRKRIGNGKLPVLFMVHGSSTSARTSFDLQVPGAGEYSMMNVFAQDGFDVWTMDHEGYGKSDRTEGNSDIASGVED